MRHSKLPQLLVEVEAVAKEMGEVDAPVQAQSVRACVEVRVDDLQLFPAKFSQAVSPAECSPEGPPRRRRQGWGSGVIAALAQRGRNRTGTSPSSATRFGNCVSGAMQRLEPKRQWGHRYT